MILNRALSCEHCIWWIRSAKLTPRGSKRLFFEFTDALCHSIASINDTNNEKGRSISYAISKIRSSV